MIENINITCLLVIAGMLFLPHLWGNNDPPFFIKAVIIVPGLLGIAGFIATSLILIWR